MKLLNVLASVLLMSTVSMASQQAADAMPGKLKVETEETVIDKGAGTVTKYRNDKLKVVGAPAKKSRDGNSWITKGTDADVKEGQQKKADAWKETDRYSHMSAEDKAASAETHSKMLKESDNEMSARNEVRAKAWRSPEDNKVLENPLSNKRITAAKSKFEAPKQESDAEKLKRIKETNMAAAKARREAILAKKNPPAAEKQKRDLPPLTSTIVEEQLPR